MTMIDAVVATIWLGFAVAFFLSYIKMSAEEIESPTISFAVAFAPIVFLVFCFFYYGGAK